ncbi:MAG: UDP-N-acetylmuramate dehydrogenase [Oscillospiraceae bacterium]|nr:UDP-N-acetylmuramate dehydrogenase [Oscillospiraceae bacterium]
MTSFADEIRAVFPDTDIRERVDMRDYTSFRIGGRADLMVSPRDTDELCLVWKRAHETGQPVYLLGNGSNILVSDAGLRGTVIRLTGLNGVTADGDTVTAQCGARLSKMAVVACNAELKGLAFAHGIPGTVGGALYMNAGAYGGQMSDVIARTVFLGSDGERRELNGAEHNFGYRRGYFTDAADCLILETSAVLKYGHSLDIRRDMDDYAERRRARQPMSQPSAGSVFKRPEGHFAGGLIEQCGLKGLAVGGAKVSEKHAGFIVNTGGAKCADVLKLIEIIQKTVLAKTGVELKPEIKVIG